MPDIYRHAQDIVAMNAVWDAWIVPGHTPPRATVIAPGLSGASGALAESRFFNGRGKGEGPQGLSALQPRMQGTRYWSAGLGEA